MQQKQKKKWGPRIAGLIAAAAAALIYSLLFPLKQWQHFVIFGCAAAGAGWLVYVMAKGVDTSNPAPAQRKIRHTGSASADELIGRGQEMMHLIRRENALIRDAALSGQIEKLDQAAYQILKTVAEKPALAPRIRRFMDYYLPTSLKMLEGYRKMDERGVSGEAAQSARAQIRRAMDVVIAAFEKQLLHFHQDDILDISTDIDVLEAMLKQDGLIDTGLTENQN